MGAGSVVAGAADVGAAVVGAAVVGAVVVGAVLLGLADVAAMDCGSAPSFPLMALMAAPPQQSATTRAIPPTAHARALDRFAGAAGMGWLKRVASWG
ncbi:hypothetical protein A6A27_27780 [Micromonospora sp. CB01531]|nr:hypothetical protein A6A27_27780 [Micromonospora sp. CB01531]